MPPQEWFSGFPEVARRLLVFLPAAVSAAVFVLAGPTRSSRPREIRPGGAGAAARRRC